MSKHKPEDTKFITDSYLKELIKRNQFNENEFFEFPSNTSDAVYLFWRNYQKFKEHLDIGQIEEINYILSNLKPYDDEFEYKAGTVYYVDYANQIYKFIGDTNSTGNRPNPTQSNNYWQMLSFGETYFRPAPINVGEYDGKTSGYLYKSLKKYHNSIVRKDSESTVGIYPIIKPLAYTVYVNITRETNDYDNLIFSNYDDAIDYILNTRGNIDEVWTVIINSGFILEIMLHGNINIIGLCDVNIDRITLDNEFFNEKCKIENLNIDYLESIDDEVFHELYIIDCVIQYANYKFNLVTKDYVEYYIRNCYINSYSVILSESGGVLNTHIQRINELAGYFNQCIFSDDISVPNGFNIYLYECFLTTIDIGVDTLCFMRNCSTKGLSERMLIFNNEGSTLYINGGGLFDVFYNNETIYNFNNCYQLVLPTLMSSEVDNYTIITNAVLNVVLENATQDLTLNIESMISEICVNVVQEGFQKLIIEGNNIQTPSGLVDSIEIDKSCSFKIYRVGDIITINDINFNTTNDLLQ